MSIRPVVLGGMIQSQQSLSNVAQNEDQRPMLQHQQAYQSVTKHEEAAAKQVYHKDNAEAQEYRFDARDGGKNQYYGSGRQKKDRKKEKADDGQVLVKGRVGGFDMTV